MVGRALRWLPNPSSMLHGDRRPATKAEVAVEALPERYPADDLVQETP